MSQANSGFARALKQLQNALGNLGPASTIEPPFIEADSDDSYKRDAFRNALNILCEKETESSLDDEAIDKFIHFFENLYAPKFCDSTRKPSMLRWKTSYSDIRRHNRFRHMYSDVCEVMFSQLDTRDLDNGVPYGVIRLENNIIMIKDVALSKNCSLSRFWLA